MLKAKFFSAWLVLAAVTLSVDVDARPWGGHFGYYPNFGFSFGYPWYPSPWYSYGPYPYYPPQIITVPVNPPVYIERSVPPAQQRPSGYWYYCNDPKGYYPYVKQCPSGWRAVEPAPPPDWR